MAALEHFGLKDKVAGKLVFGENISQAAQFVQSGNAQAGLIALSLAVSPAMKDSGRYWELPADSYPELQQAVALLSASKHKAAAKAFLDYVTSAEGAAVLETVRFSRTLTQMIVQALTLTLRLAIVVSAILLVVGVPLAYWLAFSRRRWKFLVEAVVSLPIVLPPTVLGFYVLVAVGPSTARWDAGIRRSPATASRLPLRAWSSARFCTACPLRCSPWQLRSPR